MSNKIFWFEPDFKRLGDGDRIKVWSTHLKNLQISNEKIEFEFEYDDSYFSIRLDHGNPGFYNGKIICDNESIGNISCQRFNSNSRLILEGSYDVPSEGNFGCFIEMDYTP